jgi:hypothetical protein
VALYELSLTQHPLYQNIAVGRVTKAPMFNAAYTGPKRPDLDVIGASAQVVKGRELQLTGQVLTPIELSQPAVYSFLIDRGGASSPGPIAGRPRIPFDAVVEVVTGGSVPVGTVSLLGSQGQAPSTVVLPSSSMRIAGTAVNVTLPTSLLPSSWPGGPHHRLSGDAYAFAAGLPGSSVSASAGFAPEYTQAVIA